MKITLKNPIQISKECKDKPAQTLIACYIYTTLILVFCITVISIYHLVLFGIGSLKQQNLNIADFEAIGIELIDENTLVTITDDAQLIYENKGNVKNLSFKVETSADPGEWVLFYQNNENAGYSIEKMVYAKQVGDMYVFEMPANTIKIRFDLGVIPSNTMEFESIQINTFSFINITNIGTETLFYAFILPLVLYTILLMINEMKFINTIVLKILPKKNR